MAQNVQNFLEIHQRKKSSGTTFVLSQAGIELPSKIPTNILPASSLM